MKCKWGILQSRQEIYSDVKNNGYVSRISEKTTLKKKIAEIFCTISNFNPVMQISLCFETLLLLTKDRIIDRQKAFPAKHFIQINNTVAFKVV